MVFDRTPTPSLRCLSCRAAKAQRVRHRRGYPAGRRTRPRGVQLRPDPRLLRHPSPGRWHGRRRHV